MMDYLNAKVKTNSKSAINVLLIVSLLYLILFQGLEANASVMTDAQRLHELGIVKGDGNGYLEEKALTRAEALTLILRLVKKNNDVNEPLFSDIEDSDWYYNDIAIAYTMGIVNGFTDNTFRPNEYVTRNSFLKMLLEVLGYDYGNDFRWEEVESYAQIIGIIEEKIEQDKVLIRGESFTFIVKLLDASMKGNTINYLDTLLNQQVVSDVAYSKYRESALLSDIKLKAIKQPKVKYLVIEFTDDIQFDQPNLVVEIQSGRTKSVVNDPTKLKIYPSSIQVDLSDLAVLVSDRIYCKGLIDSYHNEVATIDAAYDISTTAIDYNYYLSSVTNVGKQLILLDFSQPVTDEALLINKYRVMKNDGFAFFNLVQISDNQVVIALHDELVETDRVSVMILGSMKDIYSNAFLDGLMISYDVVLDKERLDDLQIETVESLGDGVIRVVYNQPIDRLKGLDRQNYELKDLSRGSGYQSVSKVVSSGTGDLLDRQFDILSNQLEDKNMYYLKAADISTIGNASTLEQQQIRFTYTDKTFELMMLSVEVFDSQHIKVNFNQPLTQGDIDDAVIKVGGFTAFRNVLNEDQASIDIFTEKPLTAKTNYHVYIENLRSSLDIEMIKSSIGFTASSELRNELNVEVGNNSTMDFILSFDKEIKAFAEEKPLRIYKVLEDESKIQLDGDEYNFISGNELLLYADPDNVKSYIIYDVYLQGDDFYIGKVNVQVDYE